jgi:cupin superfamily acireductone dioxygenase involved in methionine salvage
MPRKKSVKRSANEFKLAADDVAAFLSTASAGQSKEHVSWLHDYAIIRLYRDFESMMLDALVGAINNDSATVAATTGVTFPKHMTDEVCEFLITGAGYFDFKGRDGLVGKLKSFVPSSHYLVTATKKPAYSSTLDRLSALRNFAAHGSAKSKGAALKALNCERLSSSGAWLKRQGRFQRIVDGLKALATEIEGAALY